MVEDKGDTTSSELEVEDTQEGKFKKILKYKLIEKAKQGGDATN